MGGSLEPTKPTRHSAPVVHMRLIAKDFIKGDLKQWDV